MASAPSYSVLRQVHRLLTLGAVGGMSDAELLDSFVSQRDEAAEAAFEELMIRHGPMVFRVCRGVLRDTHHAEDAFQATFLVLAHRARSIRRQTSIASWLYGVAHRVASRAKSNAMRRRARDLRVAVQTTESYVPAEECPDSVTLHEEINRLPAELRAPVALCYLEGLTYEVAAQHLGVSEGTVRGRLARGRERLRRRLSARGITVPAGLLVAGAAGQSNEVISASLVHSTVHIALGFMAGKAANVLARGVLSSMLLKQLKIATILLLLGIAGPFLTWRAVAGLIDDNGQADRARVAGKTPAAAPATTLEPKSPSSALPYRLTGVVRIEGTSEPAAGAKLRIHMDDSFNSHGPTQRLVESGADGLFAVDLPAGPVRVEVSEPPTGYYWFRKGPGWMDSFFMGPDAPEIHREYRVREGTVWVFQFTRGTERKPASGFVSGSDLGSRELFEAQADDDGQLHFTLPSEGRKVALQVRESSPAASRLETGTLLLGLEWESNFRPAELKEIILEEQRGRRFRLIDASDKRATLATATAIEPVIENGELVIRVPQHDRDSLDSFGAVTGQVLDDMDRPISGVLVGLAATRYRVSNELRHQSTTNAEGRYRLRDIPRHGIGGRPLTFQIVVVKEGYAGFVSSPLAFKGGTTGPFQVLDPVRLKPGALINGVVVDRRGQPVAGARVCSDKPVPYRGLSETTQTAYTDENGRFIMRDLRHGMALLSAYNGIVFNAWEHVMVGSAQSVLLQLPEERLRRDLPPNALARCGPLSVGQDAMEWQVRRWSDDQAHSLVGDQGKAIVLYFWGTDFRQSVEALPALGKLVARFQPRDVVFRAIHRPDGNEKRTIEEARGVLALKEAPLVFALDQIRFEGHSRGMTAQQYGVINYPVVILIDRAGRIAFRSDMAAYERNVAAVFMQILTDPKAMTDEKANQLVEQAIGEEIESVLVPMGQIRQRRNASTFTLDPQ